MAIFTSRLAELIEGDEHDPDIVLGNDLRSQIRQDGTVGVGGCGCEAVLIVRGPEAGRSAAIRDLLAQLDG